jgi:HAD superfamily hydrolase (TIGR01484 family)
MNVVRAFATDYDGTIAHHGTVDAPTLAALQKVKDRGLKLLLVTGREVPDLLNVFSEAAIFDLIVAENGALLYWPLEDRERLLATPPPPAFAERLRAKGVNELSVGRIIVATMETYETPVRESLAELNLALELIPNKGSLMVLPKGVDKGFGLKAGLAEFGLATSEAAAVGDAENDLAFFQAAGLSAAVANALPAVKARASWVAPSGHGAGVAEFIDHLLA